MVMPVNVAPNPQSERAQTTETPCSEPKTRFGEYPGLILRRASLPGIRCARSGRSSTMRLPASMATLTCLIRLRVARRSRPSLSPSLSPSGGCAPV